MTYGCQIHEIILSGGHTERRDKGGRGHLSDCTCTCLACPGQVQQAHAVPTHLPKSRVLRTLWQRQVGSAPFPAHLSLAPRRTKRP